MKKIFSILILILFCSFFMTSCGKKNADETNASNSANIGENIEPIAEEIPLYESILKDMTLEEKIYQMFIVTPEQLTDVKVTTRASEATKKKLIEKPVGGIVYFEKNLQNREQTKEMLSNIQDYSRDISGIPLFLAIDEEGGTVSRISGNAGFNVGEIENMSEIGKKDVSEAGKVGNTVGTYLHELGFNLNFAPVADVLSNPDNTVVKYRSFGSNAEVVSKMCAEYSRALKSHRVLSCYKHFPGHGSTSTDSHHGLAVSNRTLDELKANELLPFVSAVENEIPFIMISHISLPEIDTSPASLSKIIITDLLKNELGYKGIVISDAMNMQAITEGYGSESVALKAVEAGVDIILMPEDFNVAYDSLLKAVKRGDISEKRIDESVIKIIKTKLEL